MLSDKKRSSELYSWLKRYLNDEPAKILDYGGGNGRLMSAFVDAGHECAVVDYVEDTLPSIKRIGSNVNDIPETLLFDIIICSHVLEHLQNPRDILKQLSIHLKEKGILYGEVPFEIWDWIPLPIEPVTHINFFTPKSMRSLFSLLGLHVLFCEEGLFTTAQGGRSFAIRAFAQRIGYVTKSTPVNNGNLEETKKLISPSIFMKWQRFFKYSVYRRRVFKKWTKRYLPETFFWRFFN